MSHSKHSQKEVDLAIILSADSFNDKISVQNSRSPEFITYCYNYRMTHLALILLKAWAVTAVEGFRTSQMCSSAVSWFSKTPLHIQTSLCATSPAFKLMLLACLTNFIARLLSLTSNMLKQQVRFYIRSYLLWFLQGVLKNGRFLSVNCNYCMSSTRTMLCLHIYEVLTFILRSSKCLKWPLQDS